MTRKNNETKRRLLLAALGAALVTVAAVQVASGGVRGSAEPGRLAFRAELNMRGELGDCPAGTPSGVRCGLRHGSGFVRGLGSVSESYVNLEQLNAEGCPDLFRVLPKTARFTVAGKGTIDFAVPASTGCYSDARDQVLTPTYPPFTITGGSGVYAGASGSGTLTHRVHRLFSCPCAAGTDVWVGSLVVPGLAFDVTAPTLSGAAGKTVRAPRGASRVRVTYKVVARDAVDGAVPLSCRPRSGSRFKIGRTVVTCSATDRSANTRTASFTITVIAGR